MAFQASTGGAQFKRTLDSRASDPIQIPYESSNLKRFALHRVC